MSEPMTDERYQTIQAHAEIARSWRDTPDSYADVQIPLMAMILGADVLTLIAEVDRLRAEVDEGNAALHEQIQAWMSQKAEVDRLRAREQALQLQLDAMSSLLLDVQRDCVAARQEANAMRPIVAAVAEHIGASVSDDFRLCSFCANGAIESRVIYHSDDCEVEQARAFVAAHPAAGEAVESEGE